MKIFEFECGCKWPIVKDSTNRNILPDLDVDITNLPDCHRAWQLVGRGDTKGVFQLESKLGQTWSKRLVPRTIEHMSALVSLIRPGCLQVKDEEGVSMTEHYCRRKNKEEISHSVHEKLDPILGPTEQSILYQEQCMRLGAEIAGFDLKQVDRLRKAIGKKSLKEMAEVKKEFLEGAKIKESIPYDLAETIWGWIEKSGRYLFNKSHSVSYGMIGYDTAYLKSHFPVQFFTSWLHFAKDKLDPTQEVRELIQEAKKFDIQVFTPKICFKKKHFHTDGINIYFGLTDIKGIGDLTLEKLFNSLDHIDGDLINLTWKEWLLKIVWNHFSVTSKMIMAGCFDHLKIKRQRMLAEASVVNNLTDKELSWMDKNTSGSSFLKSLQLLAQERPMGGCANNNRRLLVKSHIMLLENPPNPQDDSIPWVVWAEEQAFGLAITYSRVEAYSPMDVNCSCKEYICGKMGMAILGVEVRDFKTVMVKKGRSVGKEMAFLIVADKTGALDDVICFSEVWEKYKNFVLKNNTIIIRGERSKKGSGLIVQSISQME